MGFVPIDFNNPINSNFIGIGTAHKTISAQFLGKVSINGQWWTARTTQSQPILAGEAIRIVGRHDLTLFVLSV